MRLDAKAQRKPARERGGERRIIGKRTLQVHFFTKLRILFESWFGTVGFSALVASPPQSKGPFKAFDAHSFQMTKGVLILHPPPSPPVSNPPHRTTTLQYTAHPCCSSPPPLRSEKKSSSGGIGVRVVVDAVPLFLSVCL